MAKKSTPWKRLTFSCLGLLFAPPGRMCREQRAPSLTAATHDGQDVQEDVDDVSVEAKGSEDVLLWTQSQLLVAQEELGIHSQELQAQKQGQSAPLILRLFPIVLSIITGVNSVIFCLVAKLYNDHTKSHWPQRHPNKSLLLLFHYIIFQFSLDFSINGSLYCIYIIWRMKLSSSGLLCPVGLSFTTKHKVSISPSSCSISLSGILTSLLVHQYFQPEFPWLLQLACSADQAKVPTLYSKYHPDCLTLSLLSQPIPLNLKAIFWPWVEAPLEHATRKLLSALNIYFPHHAPSPPEL